MTEPQRKIKQFLVNQNEETKNEMKLYWLQGVNYEVYLKGKWYKLFDNPTFDEQPHFYRRVKVED